jgi:hypothetical protein
MGKAQLDATRKSYSVMMAVCRKVGDRLRN